MQLPFFGKLILAYAPTFRAPRFELKTTSFHFERGFAAAHQSSLYVKCGRTSESRLVVIYVKWVTREKAKVDRIACPWLIKKFVDKNPEFLFVPPETIPQVVKDTGAIAYDAKGVELTHYKENGEERVSFDAIVKKYKLTDPALLELAKIVRGADAKIPNAPPESAGLEAVAHGFRNLAKDDFDNMRLQFPTYDALYKYCQLKTVRAQQLEYNIAQPAR